MDKKKKEKQPSLKEFADGIRALSDQELIQIYNLGINQLQTIALQFKSRVMSNLMKNKKVKGT